MNTAGKAAYADQSCGAFLQQPKQVKEKLILKLDQRISFGVSKCLADGVGSYAVGGLDVASSSFVPSLMSAQPSRQGRVATSKPVNLLKESKYVKSRKLVTRPPVVVEG